jgi:hypothetical protein
MAGSLTKKYDVGITKMIDITTHNNIPQGTTAEQAEAIKMTADQTKSTPQPVLLSIAEMHQRLASPLSPDDRPKISTFLYKNSSKDQKESTKNQIMQIMGKDAFNAMKVAGLTYDADKESKAVVDELNSIMNPVDPKISEAKASVSKSNPAISGISDKSLATLLGEKAKGNLPDKLPENGLLDNAIIETFRSAGLTDEQINSVSPVKAGLKGMVNTVGVLSGAKNPVTTILPEVYSAVSDFFNAFKVDPAKTSVLPAKSSIELALAQKATKEYEQLMFEYRQDPLAPDAQAKVARMKMIATELAKSNGSSGKVVLGK